MNLLFINWTVDPIAFSIGSFSVKWYGVLFALGFVFGYLITEWIYRREKLDGKALDIGELDGLLFVLIVSTILGARLGHVIFYEPGRYFTDPIEILNIRGGGMASHGGVVGVFIGVILWSKWKKRRLTWLTDRIAAQIALTACFIRLGNLMNHEIVGDVTDMPWAFKFSRYYGDMNEAVAGFLPQARHPAQLYEAFAYFVVFVFLFWGYRKGLADKKPGFLSGMYFILVFSARFCIEFFKVNLTQVHEYLPINMGQLLSIPALLLGVWFLTKHKRDLSEFIPKTRL